MQPLGPAFHVPRIQAKGNGRRGGRQAEMERRKAIMDDGKDLFGESLAHGLRDPLGVPGSAPAPVLQKPWADAWIDVPPTSPGSSSGCITVPEKADSPPGSPLWPDELSYLAAHVFSEPESRKRKADDDYYFEQESHASKADDDYYFIEPESRASSRPASPSISAAVPACDLTAPDMPSPNLSQCISLLNSPDFLNDLGADSPPLPGGSCLRVRGGSLASVSSAHFRPRVQQRRGSGLAHENWVV